MSSVNSGLDNRKSLASWVFQPSNLGCLDEKAGQIEFKPLTIVCGQNNTGKTWAMYALYGFLVGSFVRKFPEIDAMIDTLVKEGLANLDLEIWLNKNGKQIIDLINEGISKNLANVFNSDVALFEKSKFDWMVTEDQLKQRAISQPMDIRLSIGRDKNEVLRVIKETDNSQIKFMLGSEHKLPDLVFVISDILQRHLIGNTSGTQVFLIPAERNGLHLFYKELSNRRNTLLHHASKKDFNINQLIKDVVTSRYAQPIADYIDWLNDLPEIRKKRSGDFHTLALELKRLVGGSYDINSDGDISFTPKKVKNVDSPKIDLHLTSSTVKSLFGLWAYLEYEAKKGDVLMIDEPELNLHPSNQRLLARFLAKLVNQGLRVIISTHSDYLVREINSLIMLTKQHTKRQELMKKFDYTEDAVLAPKNVAAWLFDNRTIKPMDVAIDEGINATTFDEVINKLNETSNDIYYTFQEDDSEID